MALIITAVAVTTIAATTAVTWLGYSKRVEQTAQTGDDVDALSSDPGLLKKHSTQRSYTVNGIHYPSIRTFYHSHPQASKLPVEPACLPLLVFIHGLGGSVAQFANLLTTLVNVAPCLAIDLPGCGLSEFEPKDWSAYRLNHFRDLIADAIQQHLDVDNHQHVVLIGHSLGSSIALFIAEDSVVSEHVSGLIAVCPRANDLSQAERRAAKLASYLPLPLFDAFRALDKRGGLDSASVSRFVGTGADIETRRLQLRYNEQSRSPVILRFVAGFVDHGVHDTDKWAALKIPLFCIAGEDDHVTPPSNVDDIAQALKTSRGALGDHQVNGTFAHSTPTTAPDPTTSTRPAFVFKSAILPRPAGHGLLYATSTVRVVSGLIQGFLATHIDPRLSIGWQLQYLTTEGKWDVKNLEKWRKVPPISEPIAGVFRAMKTLREVDDVHTPKVFAAHWGTTEQGVRLIIDVSHDSPVYDPAGLAAGGIEYYKLPTVSKLPPTAEEVRAFIALVDGLRQQQWDGNEGARDTRLVAVHCHYGFNRTGFFIIAYLVERLGYPLQKALGHFAEQRPPGVRHDHFINELHVRYAVGLKRAPTWE